MIDCTILIYDYESPGFLNVCVQQVRKHRHPEVAQHIIIAEQSGMETYRKVVEMYGRDPDITIVPMKKVCSGYAIDFVLRFLPITTEFFCTLDVDSFPMHDNWLYAPISLIKNFGMTFVGLHSPIEDWYANNQSRTQPFFIMGPCFGVGRTSSFRELALKVGYTKHEDRPKIMGLFGFEHDTWVSGYSDDGVAASWYEDTQFEHSKLSLGITGRIGVTPHEGEFGRVIGGLVVHICFSYTGSLHGARRLERLGHEYFDVYDRIVNGDPGKAMEYILSNIEYRTDLAPMEYWNKWSIVETPNDVKWMLNALTK